MIHQKYELSTDSLELCKGKLVPGLAATWGEIVGNIENQEDLVEYISTHGGGGGVTTWGRISGSLTNQTDLVNYIELMNNTYFNATKTWVNAQGYAYTNAVITKYIPDALVGYATESWVSSQNYLTSTALTGYATESWVSGQGYLVSADLSQYATRQWVTGRGYLTSESLSGYATESWVGQQGYITSVYVDEAIEGAITDGSGGYIWDIPIQDIQGQINELGNALGVIESNYVTMSDVSSALSGYATETWVQNQGYASDTDLDSLDTRVSALETNYGDAVTTTNNILGV